MCCTSESPSVLSLDRTFNLGNVFVMVTSYKHKGLLHKGSNGHPILFGPVMLHGTSTFEIYSKFMDNLATEFGSNKQPKLVIGSDDEAALRRAIRETFPNSYIILCMRHLRNNVDDFLKNKVGLKQPDRQEILVALFADN